MTVQLQHRWAAGWQLEANKVPSQREEKTDSGVERRPNEGREGGRIQIWQAEPDDRPGFRGRHPATPKFRIQYYTMKKLQMSLNRAELTATVD